MQKYFLMDNFDIVKSEIFQSEEFAVYKIEDNGLYEIVIYEEDIETIIMEDYEYSVPTNRPILIGTVIMESNDYDTLDLFRRLRGYVENKI
jgi:hypothetical protein